MRFFDRLIAAREREARRQVNRYLSTLDSATLQSLGRDPKEFRTVVRARDIL